MLCHKILLAGLTIAVFGCSAPGDFPDVRAEPGASLFPSDYTGAFRLALDPSAAAQDNEALGVPADVSLQPSPAGDGAASLDAPAQQLQYYHVELFTDGDAITRCTVQNDDRDGSYSDASCRREGEIVQIVVQGSSAGRLVFEFAKPDAAAASCNTHSCRFRPRSAR